MLILFTPQFFQFFSSCLSLFVFVRLLLFFGCSLEALEALVAEMQVALSKYAKQNPNDPPMKNQSLVHQLKYEVEERDSHEKQRSKQQRKKQTHGKQKMEEPKTSGSW